MLVVVVWWSGGWDGGCVCGCFGWVAAAAVVWW